MAGVKFRSYNTATARLAELTDGRFARRRGFGSTLSNNLGQCRLKPIERLLRPNLVKLVELFKDRDVFAERYPCLLAACEDLYIRGAPIWVIHGSDTYIP